MTPQLDAEGQAEKRRGGPLPLTLEQWAVIAEYRVAAQCEQDEATHYPVTPRQSQRLAADESPQQCGSTQRQDDQGNSDVPHLFGDPHGASMVQPGLEPQTPGRRRPEPSFAEPAKAGHSPGAMYPMMA